MREPGRALVLLIGEAPARQPCPPSSARPPAPRPGHSTLMRCAYLWRDTKRGQMISPHTASLKRTSREDSMIPAGRDSRKKIDGPNAGRVDRFLPRQKGDGNCSPNRSTQGQPLVLGQCCSRESP